MREAFAIAVLGILLMICAQLAIMTEALEAVNDTLRQHDPWGGVSYPLSSFDELVESPPEGTVLYCDDCNPDLNCTRGGTGAVAFWMGDSWTCDLREHHDRDLGKAGDPK